MGCEQYCHLRETACGMNAVLNPSKHAGSDPEAFWLQPVMAITASVQPESGRIVYAGSDFPHPSQFRFSEKGMGFTVQKPGPNLDSLVRVWPNSSGLKARWCACRNHRTRLLAGRNRPATSFPFSDSAAFFHRCPG